jgi:CheY-like chemotaxis protein
MTSRARVLVVEDDEDIRAAIEMALDVNGFTVSSAGDGFDALDRLRAHPKPAVILLDLRMPRMNGLEFLRTVRLDPALPRIPVVVVTGDSPSAREALAAGADGILIKPFDTSSLVNSIARFTS